MKNFSLRTVSAVAIAACAFLVPLAGSVQSAAASGSATAWRSETLHYAFANEHCALQRVPKGEAPAFGDGDICRYDIVDPKTKKKVGHAGFSFGMSPTSRSSPVRTAAVMGPGTAEIRRSAGRAKGSVNGVISCLIRSASPPAHCASLSAR